MATSELYTGHVNEETTEAEVEATHGPNSMDSHLRRQISLLLTLTVQRSATDLKG